MATNGADSESQSQRSWTPWLILTLLTIIASSAVFLPAGMIPWPECQIHKYSGMYCPGCGGTRAARSLTGGDVMLAMRQNILVFPVLIGSAWATLAFAVRRLTGRNWWSPASIGWRTMWILLVLVLIFTVLRNTQLGSFLSP